MDVVRWGILSAANIAYSEIVPALRRAGQAEVVAIASKSTEKAERFHTNVIYEHYEQLLEDASIDAVYIPLPNSLHAEWAIKAMEYGKHVLLEKPATLNEEDMIKVKRAAEKNNVVFMEAFMYQFHRQHKRVKELLQQGVIGDFRHYKAHFSYMLENMDDIRMKRELGGGAMWDVGCYGIHAATQIVGFKPERIVMHGKLDRAEGVDLTSTCLLFDQQNRIAEITVSMELPFMNRYEIIGSKGSMLVDSAFRPDVADDQFGKITVRDDNGNVVLFERIKDDQYLNQIEHFHECIINGKQPIYHAERSRLMTRYLEKAYESFYKASIVVNV